jgi:hypothetical protein
VQSSSEHFSGLTDDAVVSLLYSFITLIILLIFYGVLLKILGAATSKTGSRDSPSHVRNTISLVLDLNRPTKRLIAHLSPVHYRNPLDSFIKSTKKLVSSKNRQIPRVDSTVMDSPDSPLSDVRSDEIDEEFPQSARTPSASPVFEEPHQRPAKRQRVSGGATRGGHRKASNNPHPPAPSIPTFDVHEEAAGLANIPSDEDISSDTDGSVPGSPHLGATTAGDDEGDMPLGGKEQISVCKWEGCEAGDLGNMDLLVKHLHEEHIHARQKKYSCEWIDCSRKGIPHASGYALRAHMRSHTREKPFFCTLPGKLPVSRNLRDSRANVS